MKKDAYGDVWLRRSRKYLRDRAIYTDGNGKYFCKYYGKYIEVLRGQWGYITVLMY